MKTEKEITMSTKLLEWDDSSPWNSKAKGVGFSYEANKYTASAIAGDVHANLFTFGDHMDAVCDYEKQKVRCKLACQSHHDAICTAIEEANALDKTVIEQRNAEIKCLIAAQPKWIVVSERLPENHRELYLVWVSPDEELSHQEVAVWHFNQFHTTPKRLSHFITHWMPLFSAPNKEQP